MKLISKQIIFTFILSVLAVFAIALVINYIKGINTGFTSEEQKIINKKYIESGAKECLEKVNKEKVVNKMGEILGESADKIKDRMELKATLQEYQSAIVLLILYIFSVILVNANNKIFKNNT